MFIFLLVGTMTMVQKLGNIARRSAQCRHVVVCTHHIRRKRTWESLLKTIWDWESKPYQVSNMNHTLSKLPIKLHLLVCDVCCCAEARIRLLLFFLGLSCTKLLQCVLFSAVCRAPNRAPTVLLFTVCRAPTRFYGLLRTKSCSNACKCALEGSQIWKMKAAKWGTGFDFRLRYNMLHIVAHAVVCSSGRWGGCIDWRSWWVLHLRYGTRCRC